MLIPFRGIFSVRVVEHPVTIIAKLLCLKMARSSKYCIEASVLLRAIFSMFHGSFSMRLDAVDVEVDFFKSHKWFSM